MIYDLAADTWDDEEKKAIQEVVNSGQLTMGPKVLEYEKKFAKYFGSEYAIMFNSGSSANLVGVASMFYREHKPLHPGDEVIVPSISWSTTYHPLQQYGLKLIFVDVDLNTLNIDVGLIGKALTKKTRMIVGVSILGNPAALDVIRDFADENDLIFFEDNCESMDAEIDGKKTGTFGDFGTFSSFYSHHISTIEGGYILTDDIEINQLARSIRSHGWTRDLPEKSKLFEKYDDDFFEAYRFILPAYNVRPQEINAAVGLEQLKKLPRFTEIRRKNLKTFEKFFGNDDRFIIQCENGKSSSFCFTIILNPEFNIERESVLLKLKSAKIGHRMITGGCFTRHEVIKYFDYEIQGNLVNANLAHDRGFFVGNHPFDLSNEINYLYDVLNKI
ncbi:MAG: pyridoxamine 5-phosphate oxidase [Rhodospirillaceae bacterium]|nr:pyridoxamine 5-phosphate oxidase [Rhodospirillaceae bacterium]OUT76687.1 MAG: pyridoxamine 5-phosphate oxidase [Rhodospirillaceae bacterium TMED23]|tara:strand:+ start:564 stop:1727 length:1164 start_codon:yes stop_codon:yes gene_type:complete